METQQHAEVRKFCTSRIPRSNRRELNMATKYCEKITEAIANDEVKLKEYVQAKVHKSCSVNDNWLNVSIRYGTPGAWKLTPEYISVSVLEKEWDHHPVITINPDQYSRVILFKPQPAAKKFSSASARDERNVVLWELYYTGESEILSTEGIYAGLVPAGCAVQFVHASIKCFGPRAFGS